MLSSRVPTSALCMSLARKLDEGLRCLSMQANERSVHLVNGLIRETSYCFSFRILPPIHKTHHMETAF